MASPSYCKARRERLLERSRKGVEAMARKKAEASALEPVREWLTWRRLTDESVNRTRRVIEMQTMTDEDGKIHERILENGRVTRFRKWRSAMRALGMVE